MPMMKYSATTLIDDRITVSFSVHSTNPGNGLDSTAIRGCSETMWSVKRDVCPNQRCTWRRSRSRAATATIVAWQWELIFSVARGAAEADFQPRWISPVPILPHLISRKRVTDHVITKSGFRDENFEDITLLWQLWKALKKLQRDKTGTD